jgi:hypothetical protein
VDELGSVLVGRPLGRPRAVGMHAVAFEVGGGRRSLWLDASPDAAGLYWVSRRTERSLSDPTEASGRTRHAILLLGKHLGGARVSAVARAPGERTLILQAGATGAVALRISGAPAATLVVGETAAVTWGPGSDVWPLAEPDMERERSWRSSAPPIRSVQLPMALELAVDRDLADMPAVIGRPVAGSVANQAASWLEAAEWYLEARTRGARFRRRRSAVLADLHRARRRLERLGENLGRDLASLPEPLELRRSAETILAASAASTPGATEIDLPDPYAPGAIRRIALDPGLALHANADRLFERARRIERARARVEARLRETREVRDAIAKQDERYGEARSLSDFDDAPASRAREAPTRAGPRHYLTSRGLSVLVGRGARENHRLTFATARPEDLWFHARDVPGSHVILRDPEGRAQADDLREAAEVAAYFSGAREESLVDVHVTPRKHLRSARSGQGRVRVVHSETLRVAPRDPERRLRRR